MKYAIKHIGATLSNSMVLYVDTTTKYVSYRAYTILAWGLPIHPVLDVYQNTFQMQWQAEKPLERESLISEQTWPDDHNDNLIWPMAQRSYMIAF